MQCSECGSELDKDGRCPSCDEKTITVEKTEAAPGQAEIAEPLGGPLLLFYMLLTLLSGALGVVFAFSLPELVHFKTAEGQFAFSLGNVAGVKNLHLALAVLGLVLALGLCVACMRLLTRRSRWFLLCYGAGTVLLVGLHIARLALTGKGLAALCISLGVCVAWGLYFLLSKRVRRLFPALNSKKEEAPAA